MNSKFTCFNAADGYVECHAVFCVSDLSAPFSAQLLELEDSLQMFIKDMQGAFKPVFKRFFVNDIELHYSETEDVRQLSGCAVSVIGQPPLDGSAVALWAILKTNVSIERQGDMYIEYDGCFKHVRAAGLHGDGSSIYDKTENMLRDYCAKLQALNINFADECVRTWIFVRDIDTNYHAVARSRREFFQTLGLTADTHYIASTGIEGSGTDAVVMDAYAIGGLKAAQQRYLYAPAHLNRTHEYGVTFERGTVIDYESYRYIFISGTASINNRGEIMYPGDIRAQTNRMLENIESLLSEAQAGFSNVASMTVYLRNRCDYGVVKSVFDLRFPSIPTVFVEAAVCRPGWLVETECIAMVGS